MQRSAEPVELPSGVVTFLMTDVAGSTALWEKHPEQMRIAIARHDEIIREAVESNGGHLIKERGEGDSHFAVFRHSSDAVLAAVRIQEHLATANWPESTTVQVRIACHTGSADQWFGDYYGQPVNRCARLRAVAAPGQILLSAASYVGCADTPLDFADLGSHYLKDLQEPLYVYEALWGGRRQSLPLVGTLSRAKNNLPIQLTSFVGRKESLEKVAGLLVRTRLLTITGEGGCGKTRLALQAGADLAEMFSDGVWFVDLSAQPDANSVFRLIAEAMQLARTNELEVKTNLFNKQALIILDNCEHIIESLRPFVHELLTSSTSLAVLATSREQLHITGEFIYRIPPMSHILDSPVESPENLDAVRLFFERATARGCSSEIIHNEISHVLTLCKMLDGLPLALEQVAANADIYSPSDLLAQLQRHTAQLELEEYGISSRHKTMRATLDWSFELLTQEEQIALLRLSAFTGSFDVQAAGSVCSDGEEGPATVDQILARLVRKSLLTTVHAAGQSRFRLLEVIKDYLVAKCPEPLRTNAAKRHLNWYSGLAGDWDLRMLADPQFGFGMMEVEHDNCRGALSYALESGCAQESLALCNSLHRLWINKAFFREALHYYQKAISLNSQPVSPELATAYNVIGVISWYQGNFEAADKAVLASLEIWRTLNNQTKIAGCLNNLAISSVQQNNTHAARQYFEEAISIFSTVGDSIRGSAALMNLAKLEKDEENFDVALNLFEKAREVKAEVGDKWGLSSTLGDLSIIRLRQGDLRGARLLMCEALNVWLEHQDEILGAGLLVGSAMLLQEMENYVVAAISMATALKIYDTHEAAIPKDVQSIKQHVLTRLDIQLAADKELLEAINEVKCCLADFGGNSAEKAESAPLVDSAHGMTTQGKHEETINHT